jgi:hypothetical protein
MGTREDRSKRARYLKKCNAVREAAQRRAKQEDYDGRGESCESCERERVGDYFRRIGSSGVFRRC